MEGTACDFFVPCSTPTRVQVAAALLRYSVVLDVDEPKRAAWRGLLANLAPFPLEPLGGNQVIAEAPGVAGINNPNYVIVYFAPMFPGACIVGCLFLWGGLCRRRMAPTRRIPLVSSGAR